MKKETKIERRVISLAESQISNETNTTKFYRCMGILEEIKDDEENDLFF